MFGVGCLGLLFASFAHPGQVDLLALPLLGGLVSTFLSHTSHYGEQYKKNEADQQSYSKLDYFGWMSPAVSMAVLLAARLWVESYSSKAYLIILPLMAFPVMGFVTGRARQTEHHIISMTGMYTLVFLYGFTAPHLLEQFETEDEPTDCEVCTPLEEDNDSAD